MTNPNATTSSPRTKMLRALLLAPVTIGALAGTVVAGTGIAAAEPASAGSAVLSADTPQSTPGYTWTLTNGTDQPIWGELTKQNGEYVSRIERSQGNPLEAAPYSNVASADQPQTEGPETLWGRLCYRGNYYNVTGDWNTAHDFTFKVQQDSYGRTEGYLASENGNVKMFPTPGCY